MSAEISLRKLASTLEVDPLFSKSPDDAREDTINDSFGWVSTNRIIGQNIWNRAREYERHNSADQSRVIAVLTEALEATSRASRQTLDIIQKENFIFDGSGDRWEKLAFTIYTELTQASTDAKDALAEAKRIQEGK